jgi:hypothetical protein
MNFSQEFAFIMALANRHGRSREDSFNSPFEAPPSKKGDQDDEDDDEDDDQAASTPQADEAGAADEAGGSDEGALTVRVKTLAGDLISVELDAGATVAHLKTAIAAARPEFPVEQQRIVRFDNDESGTFRVLEDARTLGSYKLGGDAYTVDMVMAEPAFTDEQIAAVLRALEADRADEVARLLDESRDGVLRLVDKELRSEHASTLARALASNATITRVDLSTNMIGGGGAHALAHALRGNTTVASVNLFCCSVQDAGAEAFAAALRENATLESLNLGLCAITDTGLCALRDALRDGNTSLRELTLTGNACGAEGAKALKEIAAASQKNAAAAASAAL